MNTNYEREWISGREKEICRRRVTDIKPMKKTEGSIKCHLGLSVLLKLSCILKRWSYLLVLEFKIMLNYIFLNFYDYKSCRFFKWFEIHRFQFNIIIYRFI